MSSPTEPSEWTPAEMMVAVLAREIRDGELVAQGIGTHVPTLSYFVAGALHAPGIAYLYSIGGSFSLAHGELSLTDFESLSLGRAIRKVTYSDLICGLLPRMPFTEISRPAQVDGFGNFNNVSISRPSGELKLPGAVGLPDYTPYASQRGLLYVPRHGAETLVDRLDFRSGAGWLEGQSPAEREALGLDAAGATELLVTDLAVIAFSERGATLRSLHPGVELETVIERTGFELHLDGDPVLTDPPTDRELELIRELDPRGIRDLEFLPASERLDRLREIAAEEARERRPR